MTFIRRFTSDPGLEVLLEIESVNILDIEPSAPLTSVGYGTIMLVGEFEKGPYNEPTEVFGPSDVSQTFGGFGFSYAGVPGNNPCARKRTADGAVTAEYWNGNGMVALNGKKFSRLVLVRVDASLGSVQFSRCASLLGNVQTTFAVTAGQTVVTDIGAGNVTATILGTQATYAGGVFPGGGGNSGFVGGEWVDVAYDGGTTIRVYFMSTDQTPAQVAARINVYAGFTFASVNAAPGVTLTGRQFGTGGQVKVIGSNVAGTLTAIGWAITTANGTGSAVNLAAMTVAEIHTLVHAGAPKIYIDTGAGGAIRISNRGDPLIGTIQVDVTSTATAFGWATEVTASALVGNAGIIPAGTRVQNAGAAEWVTCEDVEVIAGTSTASGAGPYTVKVRAAVDDGTSTLAGVGTITTVYDVIEIDDFAVTNPSPVVAALSETALDVLYQTAFDSTININSVAKQVNTAYCARQSNAVRRKGRDNALSASASGCYGRRFCMRPPFNTTRAVAKQATEPGIGAYREERVIYCYPGASVYMPAIATRGIGGGAGFTADGFIDQGADGFMAMLCSLLPPEENPGQITDYLTAISGLESGVNVQGWTIDDYKSFKAYGIAALRMDDGTPEFQSGVTAVLPTSHPGQTRISRRRFADVMQDTMALRAKNYGKKLGTRARWSSMLAVFNDYLSGLKNAGRIEDFKIDGKKGNTPSSWAAGVRWVIAYVQTIASMDSIVLQAEIGESIDVTAV